MRTSLHGFAGSARGPVLAVSPVGRLIAGLLTFSTCMVLGGVSIRGDLFACAAALAWLLFCRPPFKVVLAFSALALAMFLPYFLIPFLPGVFFQAGANSTDAFAVARAVFVRGLSGIWVFAATFSALDMCDLRQALLRLPIPRTMVAVLLQILHQTETLLYETKSIAAAMAVRGAVGRGKAAGRVLFSLPRVWMPRVIARAERVGEAMELRGFCGESFSVVPEVKMKSIDFVVPIVAVAGLATALFVRFTERL